MLQQNRFTGSKNEPPEPTFQGMQFLSPLAGAEGLRQWIRSNPHVAIFGAILVGAGLGWILKERI